MVAQSVKNPPAVQETQVQSLDWEDELVKDTASHTSILDWRTPWTEESDGRHGAARGEHKAQLIHHQCQRNVPS